MKSSIIKILSIITIFPIVIQFIKKRKKKAKIRKAILADGDDYAVTAQNIANSISKSRDLYKNLITKAHPDRFVDNRKIRATDLSSRITKYKRNFDELTKLKVEVDSFLNEDVKI